MNVMYIPLSAIALQYLFARGWYRVGPGLYESPMGFLHEVYDEQGLRELVFFGLSPEPTLHEMVSVSEGEDATEKRVAVRAHR